MTDSSKYLPSLSYAITDTGYTITLVGISGGYAWNQLQTAIIQYCRDHKLVCKKEGALLIEVAPMGRLGVDEALRQLVSTFIRYMGVLFFCVNTRVLVKDKEKDK